MSERRIKIKIDPLGRATVEAEGFAGCGCTDATKPIVEALAGGGKVETVHKPEFFEAESAEDKIEQQSW